MNKVLTNSSDNCRFPTDPFSLPVACALKEEAEEEEEDRRRRRRGR